MQMTARLTRFERRRPMILVFLCVVFAVLFALDGFWNWPNHDDHMVHRMQHSTSVDVRYRKMLQHWPGWNHATMAQRHYFDHIVHILNFPGWHTVTDIENQRWIAIAISLLAVVGGIWWWKVNQKTITVDDTAITLVRGTRIEWSQIKQIDNRKWISHGVVEVQYKTPSGETKSVRFDSLLYDDVGPLMNAVAEKCPHAEMVNPPDFKSQVI